MEFMIWRTCFFRPGLRESWVYLGLRDSWVVTTVGPDEDFTRMSRLLRIDVIYGVFDGCSVVPHWRRPGSDSTAKTTPSVLRSFVPTWLQILTSYDFMISADCGYLQIFQFFIFPCLTWCIGDLLALAAAFVRPYVSRLHSHFASHGQR